MAEHVVVTRDLMDGSRFRSAAPGVAVVRTVDAPELADARIVLVDLALGADLGALLADGRTVIAYGAHVDDAALAAAIEAGCDDALPRSKVFRRAAELFAG